MGRQGMTLVEVLMASVFGAILMMSLTSIAGNVIQSYTTGKDATVQHRQISLSLDTIKKYVRKAESAIQVDATTLELTMPDGSTRTLAWSGTPGDELTLSIDGGIKRPLIGNVKHFSYSIKTRTENESALTLSPGPDLYFDYFPGDENWYTLNLKVGTYCCIEFKCEVDAPVEYLKLNQLKIRMARFSSGQNSDLRIGLYEIQSESVPQPINHKVAAMTVSNSSIPWDLGGGNIGFMTIDMTDEFIFHPNKHYCILLRTVGPNECCTVRIREYDESSPPVNDIRLQYTRDFGLSWKPDLDQVHFWDVPFQADIDKAEITITSADVQDRIGVRITVDMDGQEFAYSAEDRLEGGIR